MADTRPLRLAPPTRPPLRAPGSMLVLLLVAAVLLLAVLPGSQTTTAGGQTGASLACSEAAKIRARGTPGPYLAQLEAACRRGASP